MDKEALARTIWATADNLRGKVDAAQYKNYVLGLLFYKFLSDKEVGYLRAEGLPDDQIEQLLVESNEDLKRVCRGRNGYFIAYENLYSTWIEKGSRFDVSDVTTAMSAFDRLIGDGYSELFKGIFDSFLRNITNLGTDSGEQTKNLRVLIETLNDVPTDGSAGFDVLGFIYEYLLNQFASNAGKKAGEFYTPNEVSELMSIIVADHLKGRDTLLIYDPTSGSGSLLLHIGKTASEHSDKDTIRYFAQDSMADPFNLTRMNLVMKGIPPSNIQVKNADTLDKDWPNDPIGSSQPLFVDAVVSNPPYSHKWTPPDSDKRFDGYGIAPSGKADYAFLLHCLYHAKPDGVVAIVLPHGVLFREKSEYDIRRRLVELNQIETVIGLPSNMFYNTPIATIIMVLRKNRDDGSILFVDASKGFCKSGKKNALRRMDIKRISDAVIGRRTVPGFSRLVGKDEIREKGYNLTISRFVDSTEPVEDWDLSAAVIGGIPEKEVDSLSSFWGQFPSLRDTLFEETRPGYCAMRQGDLASLVRDNRDVAAFTDSICSRAADYRVLLVHELIDGLDSVDAVLTEKALVDGLWKALDGSGIDPYEAYQALIDVWSLASDDISAIQKKGAGILRKALPRIIEKNSKSKQDGWESELFDRDTIQSILLKDQLELCTGIESRISGMEAEISVIPGMIDEEWKEENQELFNEEMDSFSSPDVKRYAGKKDPGDYPEGSPERWVIEAARIMKEESDAKKELKDARKRLEDSTRTALENADEDEVRRLMAAKWIDPMIRGIEDLGDARIAELVRKVEALSSKYSNPAQPVAKAISQYEKELSDMLDDIVGEGPDMEAIEALKSILRGRWDGPFSGDQVQRFRWRLGGEEVLGALWTQFENELGLPLQSG